MAGAGARPPALSQKAVMRHQRLLEVPLMDALAGGFVLGSKGACTGA